VKAISLALLQYPILNATVNENVTEMTYHANHNIGIAIDTPKGLLVPVIREIQNKSIIEIAKDIHILQVCSNFFNVFSRLMYQAWY
jgi:pyruvate/2-oxoglutarate dehydrogenase complex dihydrolipoamide acyltransferase (E2) component